MSDYPIGAILKRDLKDAPGLFYSHMGIYTGTTGRVIHFSGLEKKAKKATIVLESLDEFAAGEQVTVHHTPESLMHAYTVVECALEEANKALHNLGQFHHNYDMAFNNCEDFCIYCYQEASKKVFHEARYSEFSQSEKTIVGGIAGIGALAYLFFKSR